MANKRGRERNGRNGGDVEVGRGGAGLLVERLRRSFAEFRRENRSRARIPQTLRDAALEAVAQGTSEQEVLRACRISQGQLDRWRECQRCPPQSHKTFLGKPRVFPVVEEPGVGTNDVAEEEEFHLRIGRWAISIRPVVS